MSALSYNNMGVCIDNNIPFNGSSAKGIIVDNKYLVYSYDTIIYSKHLATSKVFFNGRYYSKTTSRLQNIIRGIIE